MPILDPLSSELDFPPYEGRPNILVFAGTPRCGSTMLCQTLYETGLFGCPVEYMNPIYLDGWRQRLGTITLSDTIREIKRRRTSPNGIFSIQLHYTQLRYDGGPGLLEELLPDARYILLHRRDVLAQAVSFAKAMQTGQWIGGHARKREPSYDYQAIARALQKSVSETASWRYLIASRTNRFIDIAHEDTIADLTGTIGRVCKLACVDPDQFTMPNEPATKKQGDSQNENWKKRFVDEHDKTATLWPEWPYRAVYRARKYTKPLKKLMYKIRKPF